ncbi:hypothetical protein Pint_10297 [Pistacia integerrima]|uniref:Uncharacterized protein n=1 Tax=Pistacia integerrima TaxID=434235 RepID=A0ACC0XJ92_9ROSI|nr:hypothetical protein Pint_10297 [Pistacia integerrima]
MNARKLRIVRGSKGFCDNCLELVVLIEEKKDVNSNGQEKIDFYAKDTIEFYVNGYWQIVKEKEGLTSEHVISAYNLLKKGRNHRSPDSYEYDEGEEDIEDFVDESQLVVSDYDDLGDTADDKKIGKRNRSKRKQSATKRKASSKKREFIGWGSKTLLDFLDSIGKDTTCEHSLYDITTIITEYCKENRLFHPERKKIIICDARLQPLLGRKPVNRNSIYNRLTAHLAENIDHSEDESKSSLETVDECDSVVEKRIEKLSSFKKSDHKEVAAEVQKSCFASAVPKNIKLVYLRRSLVEDLAKQPETFDAKCIMRFSSANFFLELLSFMSLRAIAFLFRTYISSATLSHNKVYMDSLLLLQTPSEQARLQNEAPQVTPDEVEPEPACEESTEKAEQEHNDDSPESFPERASKDTSCSLTGNGKCQA